MTILILVNFILQTTLFQFLSIQGIFPNTALILLVSYALLRGSKEGIIAGIFTGILFDIFFGMHLGNYTVLYGFIGFFAGRGQKDFYRENYLLPILLCVIATGLYEGFFFITEFMFRDMGDIFFLFMKVLLPMEVYTVVVTIPVYRVCFSLNEHFELKEKYKYRLF